MAYNSKIRKNPITNEWEHTMQIENSSEVVWVPGLYGFYQLNSNSNNLPDIYNSSSELSYIENVNSGKIITPISNTNLNYFEYIKNNNASISNLLIDNTDFLKQKILSTTIKNDIDILYQTNLSESIVAYAYTPDSNKKNQLPNDKITFDWLLDNKSIKKQIENSTTSILSSSINLPIDFNIPVSLQCIINNNFQTINTNTIKITPQFNDNKFNTNLVINGDASNTTSNWVVQAGIPRNELIYSPESNIGRSDSYTAFNGSNDSAIELLRADFNIIGPDPSKLFNWQYKSFFGGGISRKENISICHQDILLDQYQPFINRTVLNATDVIGELFCYLGGDGNCNFYSKENYDNIVAQRYSYDRIKINIQLLDEFDNILNQNYYVFNPIHDRYRIALFLRFIDFYIPIGTKKIRIIQAYNRYHNYLTYPDPRLVDIEDTEPHYETLINPAPDYDRGYAIDGGNFELRHNAIATNINLKLFLNDNLNDRNSFKPYSQIINKIDETIIPTSNTKLLLTQQEFYSSLYDKISDLYKLNIKSQNEQLNHLYNNIWFMNKFTISEIKNVITGNEKELLNDYNNRINTNTLFI